MLTTNDFKGLRIADFKNTSPSMFKASDLDRAEELGLTTIADVLNDTHKGACKSMKAKMRSFPEAIVTAHNYLNGGFILPEKVDDSWTTAKMIEQLFTEFDTLVDKIEAIPFEGNTAGMVLRIRNILRIAKYRFLHNMTDEEISSELKNTSESCRTGHVKFTDTIKSGLKGEFVKGPAPFVLQFRLSKLFTERINKAILACTPGTSLKLLTDLIGSTKSGIVQFFLDILDANIYSSHNGTFRGKYIPIWFPYHKV